MAYVCDYCGKNFSTKQRLDYHLDKNVCNKGENTMNDQQETNEPVKPIYLFDEQKKAHQDDSGEEILYKCGGCGWKTRHKFTKCGRCGVENEF